VVKIKDGDVDDVVPRELCFCGDFIQ